MSSKTMCRSETLVKNIEWNFKLIPPGSFGTSWVFMKTRSIHTHDGNCLLANLNHLIEGIHIKN